MKDGPIGISVLVIKERKCNARKDTLQHLRNWVEELTESSASNDGVGFFIGDMLVCKLLQRIEFCEDVAKEYQTDLKPLFHFLKRCWDVLDIHLFADILPDHVVRMFLQSR